MAAHRALPYDDAAVHDPVVTGFSWRRQPGPGDQDGYQATGECPVCQGVMTRLWPVAPHSLTAKGGRPRRQRGPDAGEPWFTRCRCGQVHVGRPADDLDGGCGASLLIAPPPGGLPS